MFANMTEGEVHEVNIVLKADVQGSVEAISDSLLKLSTDEVKVKIIGPGSVDEWPDMSKDEVAAKIATLIAERLSDKN